MSTNDQEPGGSIGAARGFGPVLTRDMGGGRGPLIQAHLSESVLVLPSHKVRAQPRRPVAPRRRLPPLVAMAGWALAGGVAWFLFLVVVRWVFSLPAPDFARAAAGAVLVGGSLLIFRALVQVDLAITPRRGPHRG